MIKPKKHNSSILLYLQIILLSIEGFGLILSICAKYGNSDLALNLTAKYHKLHITQGNTMVLSLLAKNETYFLGNIRFYFREYYYGIQTKKWHPNHSLFEQIVIVMSYGEERG